MTSTPARQSRRTPTGPARVARNLRTPLPVVVYLPDGPDLLIWAVPSIVPLATVAVIVVDLEGVAQALSIQSLGPQSSLNSVGLSVCGLIAVVAAKPRDVGEENRLFAWTRPQKGVRLHNQPAPTRSVKLRLLLRSNDHAAAISEPMALDAPTPPRLITIPLSHYCEKARWGLDRVGLNYEEAPHAPLLHRLATRRSEGGTVPVLVDGPRRFSDSTDILRYANQACGGDLLYPRDVALRAEVEALEEEFDTVLGPHTRRWGYYYFLLQPELIRSMWSSGVPSREARCISVIAPITSRLVSAVYKITPTSAQRSLDRIQGIFRRVDAGLSDGRRFLVGGRFTAADLTFAALAAPALLPDGCRAVQPGLDAVPVAMRNEILRFRETDAGRFALRLFAEERA